jgi:hypothetical protein
MGYVGGVVLVLQEIFERLFVGAIVDAVLGEADAVELFALLASETLQRLH